MTQNPHTQCTYCNLSVPHGLGNVWRSGPAYAQLRGNGSSTLELTSSALIILEGRCSSKGIVSPRLSEQAT